MVEITEAKISLEDIGTASEILGRNDEHLTYIENALGVRIIVRGEEMLISGESAQVAMAEDIFNQLRSYYQGGNRLSLQEVNYALTSAKAGNMGALARLASEIS
ncbi:MAG: phosphate starvation-inducible protein PhoH, partial [Peptococcaceae bacterium]|nr:phosphate starvation-inducible protein PhoH [Peptococcaceae bacterium]